MTILPLMIRDRIRVFQYHDQLGDAAQWAVSCPFGRCYETNLFGVDFMAASQYAQRHMAWHRWAEYLRRSQA